MVARGLGRALPPDGGQQPTPVTTLPPNAHRCVIALAKMYELEEAHLCPKVALAKSASATLGYRCLAERRSARRPKTAGALVSPIRSRCFPFVRARGKDTVRQESPVPTPTRSLLDGTSEEMLHG